MNSKAQNEEEIPLKWFYAYTLTFRPMAGNFPTLINQA